MLTGNPLYPLQVEFLGKTILRGWYDRQAMRLSPYYLPLSDWRALGDTLLAVVDPRLAPFWIAALAGAWAVGGRGRLPRGHDRLTWALALLAILNIALFWICIPYRTQQRFMLQALGLGVASLARLLDRARILSLLAGLLLALHVMTPQAWPIAWGEARIPWDLSSTIPNAVGAPLPVLARLEHAFRSSSASVAFSSLAWLLTAGGCASLAVWGWSRVGARSRRRFRNQAISVVGLLGLLILCAFDTGAPGTDSRFLFYPAFRDFYPGWLNLEARSGPSGARVAYAGTNIPYYLFGSGLRNEVRYINVDRHRDWLLHDYHQAAISQGQPTDPFGRRVRISRQTIDRWIRDWRAGGFDALVPSPRQCTPRTPAEVLELAVALRRENPERTAAAIRRILRTQLGWAPDERTLQRNFHRLGLTGATRRVGAGGVRPVRGRAPERPVDWRCVARLTNSGAARRICSRSWTIIPGCCPATGGATPRTPCGWPPRCARRWPPAASRTPYMSITARPMSIRGCCGRARNSVCAWCIPHQVGPKAGEKSRGFSGPCASSSWSRSPASPTSSAATTSPTWPS